MLFCGNKRKGNQLRPRKPVLITLQQERRYNALWLFFCIIRKGCQGKSL